MKVKSEKRKVKNPNAKLFYFNKSFDSNSLTPKKKSI